MISALCINLGKGKTDVHEGERSEKIEEFVKKEAAEHRPDVVFSQDTYSKKHLEKLIPALTNNIPGSSFVLKKSVINENTKDHVGIFLNENKFIIENIEKECTQVLQKLRQEKLDFFEEDIRAIFVLAVSKLDSSRFIFSSFHAKKNKITDTKREIHIKEFFQWLEMVAVQVKADHILVGSDTNHRMRKFEKRNENKEFCVKVLLYDYPDYCERRINQLVVYDFFMISPHLTPLTTVPTVFNVDTKVLDHHPIFMQFQYHQILQPDIQPKQDPFKSFPSFTTPSSQYHPPTAQYHTQPHYFQHHLNQYPTLPSVASTAPTFIQPSFRSAGQNTTHLHFTNNSTDSSLQANLPKAKVQTKSPDVQAGACVAALSTSQVKFQCELCKKSFDTRHGLFIHFGQQKDTPHYPCKEKFPTESNQDKSICLRVFRSESSLKQHRTKQMINPRHHNPSQPFPNLVLSQS